MSLIGNDARSWRVVLTDIPQGLSQPVKALDLFFCGLLAHDPFTGVSVPTGDLIQRLGRGLGIDDLADMHAIGPGVSHNLTLVQPLALGRLQRQPVQYTRPLQFLRLDTQPGRIGTEPGSPALGRRILQPLGCAHDHPLQIAEIPAIGLAHLVFNNRGQRQPTPILSLHHLHTPERGAHIENRQSSHQQRTDALIHRPTLGHPSRHAQQHPRLRNRVRQRIRNMSTIQPRHVNGLHRTGVIQCPLDHLKALSHSPQGQLLDQQV